MTEKLLIALSVFALAFGAAALAVASDDTAFTGWVSDEACAKDYVKAGNAEHEACATGCLNRGGGVALASPDGFHLLDLTAEAALEHLGAEVTVMGTLDEETNTIAVDSIAAAAGSE